MTTVNVDVDDVVLIAAAGRNLIEHVRNEELEAAIQSMMRVTKLTWRGRKLRYPTREAAIEGLKECTNDFWGTSPYLQITRYSYRTHYRRLKVLAEMAQASIDGVIRLNDEDHQLLRKYAPALHKFAKEEVK